MLNHNNVKRGELQYFSFKTSLYGKLNQNPKDISEESFKQYVRCFCNFLCKCCELVFSFKNYERILDNNISIHNLVVLYSNNIHIFCRCSVAFLVCNMKFGFFTWTFSIRKILLVNILQLFPGKRHSVTYSVLGWLVIQDLKKKKILGCLDIHSYSHTTTKDTSLFHNGNG